MRYRTFSEYLKSQYTSPKSGTVASYLKAIEILDELFQKKDIFNLNNVSLNEIRDPQLIDRIISFVIDEEDKYKKGYRSFFDLVPSYQTSYPRKGFCRAAIQKLGDFIKILNVKNS